MTNVFANFAPFTMPITGVNPCVPGWGPCGERVGETPMS